MRGVTGIESAQADVSSFDKGSTEAERLRSATNPFHLGILRNLKAVLGGNPLLWLVPRPHCSCSKPVFEVRQTMTQQGAECENETGGATAAHPPQHTLNTIKRVPACVCGVVSGLNPMLIHPLMRTSGTSNCAIRPQEESLLSAILIAKQNFRRVSPPIATAATHSSSAGRTANASADIAAEQEELQQRPGILQRLLAHVGVHSGHEAPVSHTLLVAHGSCTDFLLSVDMGGFIICWSTTTGEALWKRSLHTSAVSVARLWPQTVGLIDCKDAGSKVLLTSSWDGAMEPSSPGRVIP